MIISFLRRVLLLALLGCMAAGISPAATVLSPRMEAGSGIDIRLESWLDDCPQSGFVPVRLRIRNTDNQSHTWTITSHSNSGGRSSVDLTVEGGKEGERMMYAPVLLHPETHYYTNIAFNVKGPGVADESAGDLDNKGYAGSRTEYIGMSSALYTKGWSALEGKFSSTHSGVSLQGSKLDMTAAPQDWRGYAGLAQLWMDEHEWTSTEPAAKAAMLEWVAMGGCVYVLCADTSDARLEQLGLPPVVNSKRRVGAGEIRTLAQPQSGNILPLDAMATEIRSAKESSRREVMSNYGRKWGLAEIVGPLTIKSGLIFGFIAVFGLLVGPVNLFWLAGAGRRQRLFWTTPLLSLAASGLLLVLMVLQDGIGGSGARTIFAIMLPEQKRIAVTQEQVVKTGVLLNRSFARTDTDIMAPISISSSSRQSYDWQTRYNVEETENLRTGAWFASRSMQSHLLQTVRPSRAGIEIFAEPAGSAPSVLSTVEVPLQRLFIVDDSGKVWAANDVGTGEKKVMRASDKAELNQWMHDHSGKIAGPMIKGMLEKVELRPGFAYAEASEASKFAIATLSSVRWNHERLLLAGPYVKH